MKILSVLFFCLKTNGKEEEKFIGEFEENRTGGIRSV
jgi:hypothetical protein